MQTQLIFLEVVIFFPIVRMSKNRAWNLENNSKNLIQNEHAYVLVGKIQNAK
jgi:hypothetical protein